MLSLVFHQIAPAITIYTPTASNETTLLQKWIGKGPLFYYDDIIALLDAIENDELEECSPKEEEELLQFLILLAREGVLPGDEETLEQDIQELLSNEEACAYPLNDVASVAFSPEMEVVFCGGWIKKQCKSAKRFVKKHKTAFIVGTVVVVAATVVIFAVASPAVAASAAGASAAATSKEKNKSVKESLFSNNDNPADETLQEQISCLKECITEDISPNTYTKEHPSFTEKARDLGALFAHEVFDGISEIGSCIPQFTKEIQEAGSRILPESTSDFPLTPLENYEKLVAKGHEKIDQIFSTDHSACYTPEAKDRKNDLIIGMCPPPGMLGELFANTNKLLKAGQAPDRAGFTKAGRALMKHGNREGSVFPKPSGNVTKMNELGQVILKEILTDSQTTIYSNRFGGKDIFSSSGRGARFDGEGNFMGFLQPKQ